MGGVSQPAGEVTLVFSDIEGSTRLLEELGVDAYREALAEHRRIVREAYARYSGYEVDYEGDAFFYTFASASDAVSAVSEAMAGLESGPIRIRVGIHTGSPGLDPPKYVGMDVHFAARVMSSAHGGQVVLSKATADLVDVEVGELGEHRLKDIAEAIPLFQLGDGSFPPLKTISNTNLPRPASSFLGRERELQEVISRIEQGARLLTLTGPGGTGKTRLALEAASTLVPSYKAGVFWVGLAALRDPALVAETIAQTLGAKDDLASHIAERELLLLLDNLEQVIEAAPDLSALLRACSNLTLLVTSRELLRIEGEVEYAVPPLAEPEAVSLFCERSQLDKSEEIAELCARLDSLPLAVELAAARTKALSPAQILERLSGRLDLLKGGRDADPRQQTLRATIAWSHELLNSDEQQLFARLSVFAGGCTLEAAEQVADADVDTLQSLVEKSLLRFTNERYWMLETIREFGRACLDGDTKASSTRDAHAACISAWCANAREELYEGDGSAATRIFDDEQHNVRSAAAWLHESGQHGQLLTLVARAIDFWEIRGEWAEGRRWADLALEHGVEPRDRARVLTMVGAFARHARDWNASRVYQLESLSIYRDLGDVGATAPVLNGLSNVAAELGEYGEAEGYLEEATELARSSGSERVAAMCAGNLADLALRQGHNVRAMALATAAVDQYRRLSWGPGLAWCLYLEGFCHLRLGNVARSVECTREALSVTSDAETLTWLFVLSGAIAGRLGRAESGAVLLGLAGALTERLDLSLTGADDQLLRESTTALIKVLGNMPFEAAETRGRSMSTEDGMAFAAASID